MYAVGTHHKIKQFLISLFLIKKNIDLLEAEGKIMS